MWELDYKESWVLKNWCFWTVVLEKTLESPLDCKEIQPVHPKGNQSWILIGRTDAEAPIFWPPDAKNQLTGKAPDTGTDWRPSDKGRQRMRWLDSTTDWMNGHELEQTPGDNGGQRSLTCCHHSWTQLRDWTTAATEKSDTALPVTTVEQRCDTNTVNLLLFLKLYLSSMFLNLGFSHSSA